MAKITIKINCGLETCEHCWFVAGTTVGFTPYCDYFNKGYEDCKSHRLIQTPGERTYFRLPECIAAEVKDGNQSSY